MGGCLTHSIPPASSIFFWLPVARPFSPAGDRSERETTETRGGVGWGVWSGGRTKAGGGRALS